MAYCCRLFTTESTASFKKPLDRRCGMRGGSGRKGSMQLSIEAIIILVIAMVLLGLGIAFIQNFFKTGTDKLTEPFDAIQFGCDPNPNRPITLSPPNPELKSGEQIQVKMCVYAKIPADDAVLGIEGCKSTSPVADAQDIPQLLTQPQDIARTEIGGFSTILTAVDTTGDDLPVGTYICTLTAVTGGQFPGTTGAETVGTTQVTVTVT